MFESQGRPGWRSLSSGAMLVWHCQCGGDCPPQSITAEQLIAELRGQNRPCDCCGEPAEFISFSTDAGEDYLEVDFGRGVVYLPRVVPAGSPLEVVA